VSCEGTEPRGCPPARCAPKEHAEAEHPGRYADPDLHILIDTTAYDAAEERV